MAPDVRARSRDIMRRELAEAAVDFCLEHGFEDVTVDEIAQGIGISRATFFRYFASKEDAIVAVVRAGSDDLGDRLRSVAPAAGELGMSAVRAALATTVEHARRSPDRRRALFRMVDGAASLRAATAYDRTKQKESLGGALEECIADPAEARAVASTGMAALELAWQIWTPDEAADFGDALDRAFALVQAAPSVRTGAGPEGSAGELGTEAADTGKAGTPEDGAPEAGTPRGR